MKKQIYRDFDHWWREGNHGWTSASYEIAQATWEDFEPTITASRDEYKEMYVQLAIQVAKDRAEYSDAMREYMDLFTKEGSPKFARWWLDQMNAKFKKEDETKEQP